MNFQDHFVRPRGTLAYKVQKSGVLIEDVCEENLVVVGSQYALAQLLGGSGAGNSINQISFGTNAAAPAFSNTAITNAFTKSIDSVSYPAGNQVQFSFSLASTQANGLAISEFGLITASGALFARRVRSSPLNMAADITVSGTWVISF